MNNEKFGTSRKDFSFAWLTARAPRRGIKA